MLFTADFVLCCAADSFLGCCPTAQVGKILIQRDEATAEPVLYYSKLPPLTGKRVVLLDPMLATGGSAKCAIQVLVDAGADIRQMVFVSVLSCPEGLNSVYKAYPGTKYWTCDVFNTKDCKLCFLQKCH